MKKKIAISLLLFALTLAGCAKTPASAVVPVDLTDDVTISNGDFEVNIYQVAAIEVKDFGDRKISIKDSNKDKYGLYEIRMRYKNLTNEESHLGYKQLSISLPNEEDLGDNLAFVGYCEPKGSDPTGDATFCAYVPSSTPGVYGVTGVFQASSLLVQPGEQAEFILVVILSKSQPEFVISFVEPE